MSTAPLTPRAQRLLDAVLASLDGTLETWLAGVKPALDDKIKQDCRERVNDFISSPDVETLQGFKFTQDEAQATVDAYFAETEEELEPKTEQLAQPAPTSDVGGSAQAERESANGTPSSEPERLSFAEIAEPLAALGIPVTPVRAESKAAFLPDWPTSATTDANQITLWDRMYGKINCAAVATGQPDGIWIFETDDPKVLDRIQAGTGHNLLAEVKTFLVRSRQGRGHVYFRNTPLALEMGNLPQTYVKHGDFSVRVRNQYCVAPGSIHPESKQPYVCLTPGVAPVPAPDWLVQWLMAQRITPAKTTKKGEDVPRNERGLIPQGYIHGWMVTQAGIMRQQGMDVEMIESNLLALVHKNCEPPIDDAKVRQVARSMERYEPNPAASLPLTPNMKPDPGSPAAGMQLISEPRGFNPWEYALKPLYGLEFSGWFPMGRITLASGSSGAMKTTFLAQALVAGRDGETFLGHEPGMLPFKFLFADRGKYDCEETFKRMNLVEKVPFECINGIPKHTAAQKISEVAASGDYKVLVIDGGDLLVEDNNDGTAVGDFTLAVQRIAEHYGVSIIVTTGAGKLSPQALKQGAERRTITKGSEVWGRTGGSVFTLNSEHDGTQDTRRLVVQHRNAPTEKFLLQMRHGRLVAVDESKLIEESQSKTLLDWVLGRESFTANEARRHFKWNGKTATEKLAALVKTGVVKQRERKSTKRFKAIVWYEVPSTMEALKKAAADYEKNKGENTVNLDEREAEA